MSRTGFFNDISLATFQSMYTTIWRQISTQAPAFCTHFYIMDDQTQLFSLRSQEQQWQMYLKVFATLHQVLFVLIGRLYILPSLTKRIHMEAILLVLTAQSTDEENGYEAMHEQEAQCGGAFSCMKCTSS
jgi:hypothetical protein